MYPVCAPVSVRRDTIFTNILIDALLYVSNGSLLCRSVLPTCSAPQQTVSTTRSTTTRRTENAFERRRLPASACLFSLESGVVLSRTLVRMTLVQSSQTSTKHDAMVWFKLKIDTNVPFSERVAIANISFQSNRKQICWRAKHTRPYRWATTSIGKNISSSSSGSISTY